MYKDDFSSVKDGNAGIGGRTVGIVRSVAVSVLVTFALFVVLSLLLTYTSLPEGIIPALVLAVSVISVTAGAASAAKSAASKGYLRGAAAGVIYVFFLYLLSALAAGGFYFNAYLAVLLAIGVFAGAFGGILGINMSDKRKRK